MKDSLLEAYENLVGLDIFDGVEIVIDADEQVGMSEGRGWAGAAVARGL